MRQYINRGGKRDRSRSLPFDAFTLRSSLRRFVDERSGTRRVVSFIDDGAAKLDVFFENAGRAGRAKQLKQRRLGKPRKL